MFRWQEFGKDGREKSTHFLIHGVTGLTLRLLLLFFCYILANIVLGFFHKNLVFEEKNLCHYLLCKVLFVSCLFLLLFENRLFLGKSVT